MFGITIKTLVVGGGAAALLWVMHNSASAGDVVDSIQNGASAVQNGYGSVQSFLHGDTGSGQGGANIIVTPNSARPGQTVTISVPSCIQPEKGTAQSSVFTGDIGLARNPQPPGGLIGSGSISVGAQNGQFSVNVQCGGVNATTFITVFGAVSPTNPPKAGAGGSVMKGDLGMTAGGIALVTGGVGYGLWSLRRRGVASGTHVG